MASTEPIHEAQTLPAVENQRGVRPVPPVRLGAALAARLVLFAVFQAMIALVFALGGVDAPVGASAAWWPFAAIGANISTLAILRALGRREGFRLRDYYRPRRGRVKQDLAYTAIVVALALPLAIVPNIGLASALFGDPQEALALFMQPLPLWAAAVALVLFPVTTALAELPLYFGYAQPRLWATGNLPAAILLPAIFLAIQHVTLPLILSAPFMTWRALMFLPFALMLAVVLQKRPSLLPYLVMVHLLLDLNVAISLLGVAY